MNVSLLSLIGISCARWKIRRVSVCPGPSGQSLFAEGVQTLAGVVLALAAATRLLAADVTFSPGAYIIDMGQIPQTEANGLKPYGMIYDLVENNQVPVSWAINPNKVTDKNPTVSVEGADI